MYECMFINRKIISSQVGRGEGHLLSDMYIYIWLICIACRILVPQPGSNLCLLHWEHRVLTAGPPWKSLDICFYILYITIFSVFKIMEKYYFIVKNTSLKNI